MASERQIAANRANAAKSTGPRSRAGKAKVAQNALRHGLAAKLPAGAHEAAAMALAHEFCAEDPALELERALAAARGLLALGRVRQVGEALIEEALAKVPAALHEDLRRDMAALEVYLSTRGRALADYERRAASALRKALRALARGRLGEQTQFLSARPPEP